MPDRYQRQQLKESSELALAERLDEMAQKTTPLFDAGDYTGALLQLATLREPVDTFFDDVMVMVDDETLRVNRLALLQALNNLFLRVADFSHWQS